MNTILQTTLYVLMVVSPLHNSMTSSVTQTPLPFLLFGIGLILALKMKWIRFKDRLDFKS